VAASAAAVGLALLPLLVLSLLFAPGSVADQSVAYAVEPGIDYVDWDDDLGLDEGWMWGGSFTFELGPRIRLSPFYLTGSDFEADPSALEDLTGAEATIFDARHVGAMLDVDLATSAVTPFLRVGGGVVRLDPEDREAIERIALSYGGAVRFGVGRAGVRLFAQRTSFRLSPERLYAAGDPDGDQATRDNLVGGARVSIPLSEGPDDPDDDAFAGRDDQTALILGGGLALRLTDRLDLEVSARDYLLDTTGDLEDASDPGELTNNWLFSAGLDLGTARDIQPYLLGGAGFYSPTFIGVNTGIGVEFDLLDIDRGDPLRSYVELQGLNLYDETRLHFGVSFRR
jgi:hypothetical protein